MGRLACRATATLGFLAAALASAALAPRPAYADGVTGPGVARLDLIVGDVAIRRGDSQTPLAAAINAPLLSGDYVTTGRNKSRAEIQLDGTTAIRLSNNVQLRMTNLEPDQTEAQLAEGTIALRLLPGAHGRPQIDTPSVSIRPDEVGYYRITVTHDGKTELNVRKGRADVVTPQGTTTVAAGESLSAQGPAANPAIHNDAALALDDFDNFNADRDREAGRALADTHLEPELAYDNLDQYGRWVDDATYGPVWVPTVAAGWEPYAHGRWLWEDTYGWTWITPEPWGWAPYHYGRWFYSGLYGWCWNPPPFGVVPIWEPALVGFVFLGDEPWGEIGWIPLAPFEPFYPWWAWGGFGFGGPTIVNVTNINITKIFINGRRPFRSLPTRRFLLGEFRDEHFSTAANVTNAREAHGQLPIVPTNDNLRFTDAPVSSELAHQPVIERGFAGKPVLATRIPFTQTRTMMTTAFAHPAAASHPATEHPSAAHPLAAHPSSGRSSVEWSTSDAWGRYSKARGGIPAQPATTSHTTPIAGRGTFASRRTSATDAWNRFSTTRGATVVTAPVTAERGYYGHSEGFEATRESTYGNGTSRSTSGGTSHSSPSSGTYRAEPSGTYRSAPSSSSSVSHSSPSTATTTSGSHR